MAIPDGYQRRGPWLVPPNDNLTAVATPRQFARPALKQPSALPTLTFPIDLEDNEPDLDRFQVDEQPLVTREYELGKYGLTYRDANVWANMLGSEERLLAVLRYVLDAHTSLEAAELPLDKRDLGLFDVREAHPKAVNGLARRLKVLIELPSQSADDLRQMLNRGVPRVIFRVEATSVDAMRQLLKVAWNVNDTLDLSGTHRCGCRTVR